ncbi:rod shape-determining protein MreC [Sphaerisporangium aureirubrum]|uniref:Cell shape-determining protein MreC n=1 Tax=Sphaerisporangium aureirubrum TaxID=1544736 RepID=A0ABW1NA10_9ACTN
MRTTLALLLAVSLVLITIDHRQRGDSLFEPFRSLGASAFGWAEQAGTAVARPVGEFFTTFTSAPEAKRRIARLRAENARLRGELTSRVLDRRRSAELAGMLGLSGLGRYRVVAAQVIARRGAPGFEDAVEIDAGAGDGVRPEMTVLNGDGLVGRVVHAGPSTSTVVLLTDPASSVGARVEQSNKVGLVTGLGLAAEGRLVRFRLLDSVSSLTAGSRIVSFGSERGTPYAPGLPIGTIERVEPTPGELTRVAYAKPFADFTALDVVGVVVQAPARDPRDAMLPPVPPPVKKPARAEAPPRAPAAGVPPASPPARDHAGEPSTAPRDTPPGRGRPRPVSPDPARPPDPDESPGTAERRDGGQGRDDDRQ